MGLSVLVRRRYSIIQRDRRQNLLSVHLEVVEIRVLPLHVTDTWIVCSLARAEFDVAKILTSVEWQPCKIRTPRPITIVLGQLCRSYPDKRSLIARQTLVTIRGRHSRCSLPR